MKKLKLTPEEKAELAKIRKKNGNLLTEFKKFINRGNVIDMAVGVIVGTAFSKIVSSLVNDIIMPFVSLMTGSVALNKQQLILRAAELDAEGNELVAAIAVNYGQFLQYIVDFLIIAICIFAFMKIATSVRMRIEKTIIAEKRERGLIKDEPPAPPTTKKCPYCLTEIAVGATRCPNCTSQLGDDGKNG